MNLRLCALMMLIICPFAVVCPAQNGPLKPQSPPPTPVSALLLENPGFEAGLSGWDSRGAQGQAFALGEAAHQGTTGMRVIHASENKSVTFASDYHRIAPGKKYETRFWARIVSGEGIAVYLGFYSKSHGLLNTQVLGNENRIPVSRPAKDFREFSVQGLAMAEAYYVRIWIYSSATAQVVADFDDFSLTELPPSP